MNGQIRTELSANHALPLARVHLFGEFQLLWHVPPLTTEALWDGRTSARTLLKLLLCAPGRQAPRGVLTGLLWPETEEEKARESLRAASKVLRKMLQTAEGEALLENRNNGDMLKLAGQDRLWVDVDAFEDGIAQASCAQDPDAALSLWQEAHTLLMRGEFLADDLDAEWVNTRWVKGRRHGLWLARCRLMRHLADAYVERGQLTLAEEILEQHLTRYPTNQDALSRLMLLLEQQGCYEQACILYERARRTLDDQGKKPTTQLKALYERVQKAVPPVYPALLAERGKNGSTAEKNGHISSFPIVLPETPRTLQDVAAVERAHPSKYSPSFPPVSQEEEEILAPLHSVFQKMEAMPLLSRRLLLKLGIAAFINRLAQLDRKHISATEREELSRSLGESIADGWKLFLSLSNAQVVAIGQTQLSLIHQAHMLIYPSNLPYLYTGTYDLIGISLHFQERNEEALQAYHNGYLAALAIGDPWYMAQNLICQSDTYLALGRHAEAIAAMEEALHSLGDIDEEHRRAKAHLLACWADANMMMGEHTEAQKRLDEAAVYLDQINVVAEFDYVCWLQVAGKNALMAGNYRQAIELLENALATNPSHWLVRHAGILIPLAMAYARLHEREASLRVARQAVSVATTVNAPMISNQLLEYIKKDILGRFSYDREVQTFLADTLQQLPQLASFVEVR